MNRWNVESIFFIGANDGFREIILDAGKVNIITGASGTGKSAIIKALDYCLGSSKCGLPIHIRRRCTVVGVKWAKGPYEMIVGRLIPGGKQRSSDIMFVSAGHRLPVPRREVDLQGRTSVETAKSIIERNFGIGDNKDLSNDSGREPLEKATVRKVTPYIFVTKEVIDSETVLLHGLEDRKKAPGIVGSMPYFLGVSSEAAVAAERRLRQLSHALEMEEDKERVKGSNDSLLKQRARVLLGEALSIGLIESTPSSSTEPELLALIESSISSDVALDEYPSDDDLHPLNRRRRDVLTELNQTKRKLRNIELAAEESRSYNSAVTKQRDKLLIAEHLGLDTLASVCPICESPTDAGRRAAASIQRSLELLNVESGNAKVLLPKIDEEVNRLGDRVQMLSSELRGLDALITATLNRIAEGKKLHSLGELRAYYRGRATYFLESTKDVLLAPAKDLSALRNEIKELEGSVDTENKRIRLRRAEDAISRQATDIFSLLPKQAPCIDAELQFSSREPQIRIIEPEPNGDILSMSDIGSDQNYLALHIALSFGLQRFFEKDNRPVPGLLVLDQLSRPYFPSTNSAMADEDDDADSDEASISRSSSGRDVISISSDDEDFRALRQHVDFLFSEVESRSGLQVILLEHAYFKDDPRYVAATKEHWTRQSGGALIPRNWKRRIE